MKNEKSLTVRNFAFATTLTALSMTIGCTPTQYVDSKGTNLVVSMNKVNIQDFEKASEALVASMVESGVLSQAPNQPVAYEAKRFLAGESQTPVDLPYFTISAKILENSTSAGSTKQVSYIFQMSLANTTSGRLVWEGEKTITKQGEKNAIGF